MYPSSLGGTRRPNRPQFEKTTSRDPLSSRGPLPLLKEVQEGRGSGSKRGRGPGLWCSSACMGPRSVLRASEKDLSGLLRRKLVSERGEGSRRVKTTPPLTPMPSKSIAIHLPFLSRCFCKSMPSSWQKLVHAPPDCITMQPLFVSQCCCRSIRVRGRWNTPTYAKVRVLWWAALLAQGFASILYRAHPEPSWT